MAEAVARNRQLKETAKMGEKESKPNGATGEGAPAFAAANQPSYARTLFFGPDGLRPGWGFALFVAIYYPVHELAVKLAEAHLFWRGGLWSGLVEEFGAFAAAAMAALVLGRIERRPWRVYGLPARQTFGKLFWIGSVWGFVAISLLMVALTGLHAFDFGRIVLHGVRLERFAAFWAVMFLGVGLFEEFLFRGYALYTLTRGIGFWPAAIALSCAFGLMHLGNEGEQWVGALAAGVIGMFFCLTFRRTGSLWFAVGFHAAWDWGETFVYSVPDSGMISPGHLMSSSLHGPGWLSGGSVGPEGSVLCFVVVGLTWVVFARVYRTTTKAIAD